MGLRLHTLATMLLVLGSATLVRADHPCYPTGTGSVWEYIDSDGGSRWLTAARSETYHGQDVVVFEWDFCCGGASPSIVQYVGLSASGDVEVHGWESWFPRYPECGDYEPPVVLLPAEISVGDEWLVSTTATAAYCSDSTVYYVQQFEQVNRVVALETVTVPAGSYLAFKIEYRTLVADSRFEGARSQHTVPWNPVATAGSEDSISTSWYVEGVGLVRREDSSGTVIELVRYSPDAVSNVLKSMSRIKAVYE